MLCHTPLCRPVSTVSEARTDSSRNWAMSSVNDAFVNGIETVGTVYVYWVPSLPMPSLESLLRYVMVRAPRSQRARQVLRVRPPGGQVPRALAASQARR